MFYILLHCRSSMWTSTTLFSLIKTRLLMIVYYPSCQFRLRNVLLSALSLPVISVQLWRLQRTCPIVIRCQQLSLHVALKILTDICECESERRRSVAVIPAPDRGLLQIFLFCSCSYKVQGQHTSGPAQGTHCVCLTFRCCRALLSSSSCRFLFSISVCHFLFSWSMMGDRVI